MNQKSGLFLIIGENWPEWVACNQILKWGTRHFSKITVAKCEDLLIQRYPGNAFLAAIKRQSLLLWNTILPQLSGLRAIEFDPSSSFAPTHWEELFGVTFLEIGPDANQKIQDILLSERFSISFSLRPTVIFSPQTIDIVRSQGGTFLNIHTAKLPDYRGVQPLYHVMDQGDYYNELTLHEISREIDAGKKFATSRTCIDYSRSLFFNYLKQAPEIADLFIRSIDEVISGNCDCQGMSAGAGFYWHPPNNEQLEGFFRTGKKLFEKRDLEEAIRSHIAFENSDLYDLFRDLEVTEL